MTCPTRKPNSCGLPDRYSATCDGELGEHGVDLSSRWRQCRRPVPVHRARSRRAATRPLSKMVASTDFAFVLDTRPASTSPMSSASARGSQRDVVGAQAVGGMLVEQPAELAGDPVRRRLRRDAGIDHRVEVRGQRGVDGQDAGVIGREAQLDRRSARDAVPGARAGGRAARRPMPRMAAAAAGRARGSSGSRSPLPCCAG